MSTTQTKYYTFKGHIYWAKVYTPDEFRGNTRWTINFQPENDEEWAKIKDSGIQKRRKVNKETGKDFIPLDRMTAKLIKGKLIKFAPPIIYDQYGKAIVKYVNSDGNDVRSYEGDERPTRVGEPILIGNGSLVAVNVSVYPTAMGPGNRLESIKVLDLIEYTPDEIPEESKEQKGPETVVETKTSASEDLNDEIPW